MMLKPFSLITVLAMAVVLSVGVVHAADSLVNQYDPNGNLVSGDGKFYEYNDANQLAKVREKDQAGAVIAEYFYDFSGQRVKKVENGVTSYYLGKDFETRVVSGQAQEDTAHFFVDNERVAKRDASGTYFYHPDHLGGTNVVTNATGIVIARNSYLPFGEMREGGEERYSYTGKEKDVATDLYYFEARFNSPELRHFTQADIADPDLSDPQDLNRYAYVGNNPMSYVDPDGYKKKKKAKLSKREKWMIAHGVDPDKDKTSLKKAKKKEKAGEKYTVIAKAATSSVRSGQVGAVNTDGGGIVEASSQKNNTYSIKNGTQNNIGAKSMILHNAPSAIKAASWIIDPFGSFKSSFGDHIVGSVVENNIPEGHPLKTVNEFLGFLPGGIGGIVGTDDAVYLKGGEGGGW